METRVFKREELYTLVWGTPMRLLAREFGLSDAGLAKICKKYDIPRPGLGYWAKRTAGQKPCQAALPNRPDLDAKQITIRPNPIRPPAADPQGAAIETVPPIVVPEILRNPHPLILNTHRALRAAEVNAEGIRCAGGDTVIPVMVARNRTTRALRIMDTLIKALMELGYPVGGGGWVDVDGVAVRIGINEIIKVSRKPMRATAGTWAFSHRSLMDYLHKPSGRLCLYMDPSTWGIERFRLRWCDGKRKRVEDLLGEFVTSLRVLATKKGQLLRERKLAREAEERRKRAWEDRVRRYKDEEARVGKLTADANDWHESQQVRSYILAVRNAALERGESIEPGSQTGEWLTWAAKQADRLDPLVKSPPSILDDPPPDSYWNWRPDGEDGE